MNMSGILHDRVVGILELVFFCVSKAKRGNTKFPMRETRAEKKSAREPKRVASSSRYCSSTVWRSVMVPPSMLTVVDPTVSVIARDA